MLYLMLNLPSNRKSFRLGLSQSSQLYHEAIPVFPANSRYQWKTTCICTLPPLGGRRTSPSSTSQMTVSSGPDIGDTWSWCNIIYNWLDISGTRSFLLHIPCMWYCWYMIFVLRIVYHGHDIGDTGSLCYIYHTETCTADGRKKYHTNQNKLY